VKSDIPQDVPTPLAKCIVLTHYFNANLYHDMATDHSVTDILHLFNQTPIDRYSKKQATVEMAMYGSEFIAAFSCVNQVIDLCNTLCYLGIYQSARQVLTCLQTTSLLCIALLCPTPSKLHKRHNALSFHHV
jgi:hypothetical protein